MRPVYVDGPLEGGDLSMPDDLAVVYDLPGARAPEPQGTYRFFPYRFAGGGKVVTVTIGYCGAEPDAEAVARALLKPEIFERAEVCDMTGDLAR
jgi:hypothetical protein